MVLYDGFIQGSEVSIVKTARSTSGDFRIGTGSRPASPYPLRQWLRFQNQAKLWRF